MPPFDSPRLLADIGATYARFTLEPASGVFDHSVSLRCADHADFHAAVSTYLGRLPTELASGIEHAAIAIANPVQGDEVRMTNYHWCFSIEQMRQRLGLESLVVLNDFEALALSLPRLQPGQLRAVGNVPALATRAALAVVGPGTGLGVAGIVPSDQGWVAVPGEGGHATLAAVDDRDAAVLAAARKAHPHVSAERLLSGIGLPALHQAVVAVAGQTAPVLTAKAIVERGLSGECALCSQTLDDFCALLGSFAGNVALTLGARGGVFIGGGIVPRLGDRFAQSAFRERFEAKGRFQTYLQAIPTWLITDTLAALTGAALALEQHHGGRGA